MKRLLIISSTVVLLGMAPQGASAQPGGCIKYGLGGAIAGKLAGGHTWKGAAAGCVVGYLRRKQYKSRQEREVLARHERQLERERAARRDRGRGDAEFYDDAPYGTGTVGRRQYGY